MRRDFYWQSLVRVLVIPYAIEFERSAFAIQKLSCRATFLTSNIIHLKYEITLKFMTDCLALSVSTSSIIDLFLILTTVYISGQSALYNLFSGLLNWFKLVY